MTEGGRNWDCVELRRRRTRSNPVAGVVVVNDETENMMMKKKKTPRLGSVQEGEKDGEDSWVHVGEEKKKKRKEMEEEEERPSQTQSLVSLLCIL